MNYDEKMKAKYLELCDRLINGSKYDPTEQPYDYRKILEQNSKEYKETRKRAY